MALLTGSDYTEGIQGVGPVCALEILAEFPSEGLDALEQFRDWLLSVQAKKNAPPENKIREKIRNLQVNPGMCFKKKGKHIFLKRKALGVAENYVFHNRARAEFRSAYSRLYGRWRRFSCLLSRTSSLRDLSTGFRDGCKLGNITRF